MHKIFSLFQDHIVFGGVANIQEIKYFVRFEALMAMTVKITVFWDVVSEGGDSRFLQNVGICQPDYMATHPRRYLSCGISFL
jgi:hypothetical protein